MWNIIIHQCIIWRCINILFKVFFHYSIFLLIYLHLFVNLSHLKSAIFYYSIQIVQVYRLRRTFKHKFCKCFGSFHIGISENHWLSLAQPVHEYMYILKKKKNITREGGKRKTWQVCVLKIKGEFERSKDFAARYFERTTGFYCTHCSYRHLIFFLVLVNRLFVCLFIYFQNSDKTKA